MMYFLTFAHVMVVARMCLGWTHESKVVRGSDRQNDLLARPSACCLLELTAIMYTGVGMVLAFTAVGMIFRWRSEQSEWSNGVIRSKTFVVRAWFRRKWSSNIGICLVAVSRLSGRATTIHHALHVVCRLCAALRACVIEAMIQAVGVQALKCWFSCGICQAPSLCCVVQLEGYYSLHAVKFYQFPDHVENGLLWLKQRHWVPSKAWRCCAPPVGSSRVCQGNVRQDARVDRLKEIPQAS